MTARILIMAGGTGGHVFPALAVADELSAQGHMVAWIGTLKGIEAKLVPASNYPLNTISVQGLRGNGVLGWILAPLKLLKAVGEAITIINKFKPDVVLGLGGFASGPGGVAAKLLGKPLVIHEQNAIPGLTNRALSIIANRVLEGFPQSFKATKQAQWVGNPVRKAIEQLRSPTQRFSERNTVIRVLVLGGSLGAKSLNTLLPQAFSKITTAIEIKHQCGPKHLDDCQKNYTNAKVDAQVTAFIDSMADAYEWADLVICRAGALTIAELTAAGVGSLLVPYPYAVDDHQTHNAQTLVNANAAIIMQESELSVESITKVIAELVSKRDGLLNMAEKARSLVKIGTAKQIAGICLEVTHG
ncbi:undecaprenyldiphospho-muramoylpentapeptide beta-N-acetylglucosaminyltransferase [Pseudomonadota bacterium]|nr:undecaprenyldiphospho-muramoylpentapeptide beta-N-acetylglucosaminyltransferase [Pseudomonadota bacterium]